MLLKRRNFILSALFATPAFPCRSASVGIEINLDIVEATRLLVITVREVVTGTEEGRREAARRAVPGIASNLVKIAAVKSQMRHDYEEWKNLYLEAHPHEFEQLGFPSARTWNRYLSGGKVFINKIVGHALQIERLIRSLNQRLRDFDPEWQVRNVETLSAVFIERHRRSGTVEVLKDIATERVGRRGLPSLENRSDPGLEFMIEYFFARQEIEAEELRRLAVQLAETVNLAR